MNRQRKLEKLLRDRTDNSVKGMERLINTLRRDDNLMAELMAVTARKGKSETTDSTFEFWPSNDGVPAAWLHGGDPESKASHYLPEPNDPEKNAT